MLNFLIVAFVLFTIVKIINRFREERKEFAESIMRGRLTRAERRELRKAGINRRDKEAVKAYFEEKKRIADEAAKKAEEEAAEKARLEREANPTTEDLLKMILEQIKANKA